jgi:hypothetical protein
MERNETRRSVFDYGGRSRVVEMVSQRVAVVVLLVAVVLSPFVFDAGTALAR